MKGLSAAKVMRPFGELSRSTEAGYGEAMVDGRGMREQPDGVAGDFGRGRRVKRNADGCGSATAGDFGCGIDTGRLGRHTSILR